MKIKELAKIWDEVGESVGAGYYGDDEPLDPAVQAIGRLLEKMMSDGLGEMEI